MAVVGRTALVCAHGALPQEEFPAMTKAFFVTARCIAWSALAWAMTCGPCHAQATFKKMGLSDLEGQADSIFVAKCAKSHAVFRNGAIVTQYQLEPTEVWKEGATLAKASSGTVTLEQVGGAIASPLPIAQMNSSSVVLKEGQQVLLFTKMPDAATGSTAKQAGRSKAATLSASSPQVVGGNMGVFSVVRDPTTGRQLVTQGTVAGTANKTNLAKAIKAQETKAQETRAKAKAGAATTKSTTGASSSSSASTTTNASSADSVASFEALSSVRSRVQAMIDASSGKKQ
jgi:hypothetical protein